MKYRGEVKDRMTGDVKKTFWKDTYQDAHNAAEKLCKRTLGSRGTIFVVDKDNYTY